MTKNFTTENNTKFSSKSGRSGGTSGSSGGQSGGQSGGKSGGQSGTSLGTNGTTSNSMNTTPLPTISLVNTNTQFLNYFQSFILQKESAFKLFKTLMDLININEFDDDLEKKFIILLIQMFYDFTLDLGLGLGSRSSGSTSSTSGSTTTATTNVTTTAASGELKLEMINAILTLLDHLLANQSYLENCKSILLIHLDSELDVHSDSDGGRSCTLLHSCFDLLSYCLEAASSAAITAQHDTHHGDIDTANHHKNSNSNISTLLTQIIKNSSCFAMHLIMLSSHHQNHFANKKNVSDKSLQLFQLILMNSCMSQTPKVRKLSTNIVKGIVEHVVAPLKVHPFTLHVLDFVAEAIKDPCLDNVLDALVFLRVVGPVFVAQSAGCSKISKKLEELCKFLLGLPAVTLSTNPILTQWVFTVLSALFASSPSAATTSTSESSSPNQLLNISIPVVVGILTMLKEMKPHASDTLLTPVWIDLITKTLVHLNTLVYFLEKEEEGEGKENQVYFTAAEKTNLLQIKSEEALEQWNVSLFSHLLESFVLEEKDGASSGGSGDKREPISAKKGKGGRRGADAGASTSGNGMVAAIVHQVALKSLVNLIQSVACISSVRSSSSSRQDGIYSLFAGRILAAMGNVLVSEKWGDLLVLAASVFEGATACIELDNVKEAREYRGVEDNVFALVEHLMTLRDDPAYSSSFPFKHQLEQGIQSAICGLGVDLFFQKVKLGIDVETGYQPPNSTRRPYLLTTLHDALSSSAMSMMKSTNKHIHSLSFIQKTMFPLIQRLHAKQKAAKTELEGKLYATMLDQCWNVVPLLIMPNHCPDSLAFDFCEKEGGGWSGVVSILGGVVSGTIECLGSDSVKCVLKGLGGVIQRVQKWKVEAGDANNGIGEWREKCWMGVVEYMPRFLAALSNLYLTPPTLQECKSKGTTLQVQHERQMQFFATPITLILGVVEEKLANEYFLVLVKKVLEEDVETQPSHSLYVLLDLMLLFMPFIQQTPTSSLEEWIQSPVGLFYQVLLGQVGEKDATLQKKTYKSLLKVFQHPSKPLEQLGVQGLSDFIQQVSADSVVSSVSSGAIKNRVALFQCLVEESMDSADRVELFKEFIPLSLPEVMLATKEANEKTRDAAYDCLVAFAKYVMQIPSPTQDESNKQQQLQELFLMVTAGLGGESPHMQSAAIATLGRLFFEFHKDLHITLIAELLDTILITMSFKNREVTKAALGFVKVCVVCMDAEAVKTHVPAIINAILLYTHRIHKSHFKSKTRHLFERLIRKFGFEYIDSLVPGTDKKLILNIRKRREAAARKKNAGVSGNTGAGAPQATSSKHKFEEAFHDSGSELGSDDEEKYIPEEYRNENSINKKDKQRKAKTVIHEDGDQVVDFLDRNVVSQVTHQFVGLKASSTSANAPGKSSSFKTGSNGRLLIEESDDDDNGMMNVDDEQASKRPQGEISEDYYKQSLASEVSFTRTADGRVKFLKRKRGEQDEATATYENGTADTEVGKRWHSGYKKGKSNTTESSGLDMSQMLGRQYKAKKAKGDVKKAGMADPYAYIPLSGKIVGNMNKSAKLDGALKGILKASTKGSTTPAVGKGAKPKGFSRTNKKHNK